MRNTVSFLAAASAPLLVAAQAPGNLGAALIVNYCSYSVPLKNVPAQADGVQNAQEEDKTLAPGNSGAASTYSQTWTPLPAGVDGGWSMKLNPLNNPDWNNIMQFEYTYTNYASNSIWYDMSFVNGQPSNFNWQFEVGGVTKTNAYTYSTDDAQGMQAPVAPSVTVTLVLCPESSGAAAAPTSSSAAPPPPAPATSSTTTTTSPPPPPSSSTTLATTATPNKNAANTPSSSAAPSTTPAPEYDIVTEYATQIVTAFVTETAAGAVVQGKHKRHEHRHPHGHKH